MERRCMNCMRIFEIPKGYEDADFCCPFCGFVENTSPENDSHLHPGVAVNERYKIGTVIGAGGFGVTYRAWDDTLDSQIAVKEYFPEGLAVRDKDGVTVSAVSSEDKEAYATGRERFLKEARSLAKFNNNPGTVTIYDFFEQNGTAYITMEYLDGCNMMEYIETKKEKVSLDMLLDITDSICNVLSVVHSTGVIHRDISPENIFAESDGTYKLIDFGAAKQQIPNEKLSSTVILKHDYAPLEQFSHKGNVGPWTDIYSLGTTLYKILTGITPKESIQRIMQDDIQEPIELRPDIPKYVSDAIMKAISLQIKDRYKTALEFKTAMHGEGKEEDYNFSRVEVSDQDRNRLKESEESSDDKNNKGGIQQQEIDMGKELQEKALSETESESFLDINDFINFDDTEVAEQSTQILRGIQEAAKQDGSQILSSGPAPGPIPGYAAPGGKAPEAKAPQEKKEPAKAEPANPQPEERMPLGYTEPPKVAPRQAPGQPGMPQRPVGYGGQPGQGQPTPPPYHPRPKQGGMLSARRDAANQFKEEHGTGTLSMSGSKMRMSKDQAHKPKGISAVIEQQTNILRATDEAAGTMPDDSEKKRKGLGSLFGKKK